MEALHLRKKKSVPFLHTSASMTIRLLINEFVSFFTIQLLKVIIDCHIPENKYSPSKFVLADSYDMFVSSWFFVSLQQRFW